MNYVVTLSNVVNFAPQTEVEEILQNVRTIIATRVGTVPLDRGFGIPYDAVDAPISVSRALMQTAIIDAIQAYEPRANVKAVNFDESEADAADGIMRPRVVISIGTDEEEEALNL